VQIQQLIEHLRFEEIKENIYWTGFATIGCELRVDFNTNSLVYPESLGLIVNERQTCNFNAPENFVVFECVHRLLSKGYKPEHIELEPKWKVGHGASGGRADILVKDNTGKAFLIIECKTYGAEFESEWKNMLIDGGQLFSYYQQERTTQYVCLYASDIIDDTRVYNSHIIAVRDNHEYLKTLKNPLSFVEASDVKALFSVWRDTYSKEYETRGIFEDSVTAYEVGKAKHTTVDLQEISHDDIQKKYHAFATILRQHNVSGRENAFDKLVNLFLAKIVDEMQNHEELMFYWRGAAFDDYYNLQDRIQRLYHDGMQKFLGEEVTYIDTTQINDAFRLFKNDPDATRETILHYFRELKFYTNNDFAFLDVHNEHLFFQNSEILLKIVRMLQDIKLKTKEQNQFLGDLFEGFLDQGVKQSEGQFFTPMPIVKFLVSSLPIEHLIRSNAEALHVIDYACGAGHFLNEYATQIHDFVDNAKLSGYYSHIVGIEKEYRLSKVAKVSAFMYGQDEIQIIYADALAHNPKIKNGTFNILISNPPFSVKGFLEMLSEEERAAFDITKVIDTKGISTNNSIEVFFVERAMQLLAPGGIAAIILPSSILSNGSAVYMKAREIILKYFDVVAIAELGSGTFGKTGTNTVTMFLRRKMEEPALADHYKNRVDTWFNGDFGKDGVFTDTELLEAYCAHIKLNFDDYKTLFVSAPNATLLDTDIFRGYKTAFDNTAEIKSLKTRQFFKNMTDAQKQIELHKKFVEYASSIEKKKLYYFMLAYTNPQPVVVVKSPSSSTKSATEMKKFLGYEWSTMKGNEGIKYFGVAALDENGEPIIGSKGIKSINTPLFNPLNLNAADKINTIIRDNFNGVSIGENEFVSRFRLVDMLDFNGVKLEMPISLTSIIKTEIKSKYPIVLLGTKCDVKIGGTPARANGAYYQNGTNLWVSIVEMNGQVITNTKEKITDIAVSESNCKLIPKGTTLLSFKLSIGKTAIAGTDLYTNEAIAGLIPFDQNELLDAYLFHLFNSHVIDLENIGFKAFGKSLNSMYLKNEIKIPLPPTDVQYEIIAACEAVDEEYNRIRMRIDEYRAKIEQLFNEMEVIIGMVYAMSDTRLFSISIGKRVVETQLVPDGEILVYSANVLEPFGYINERLLTDFSTPSVLWGIDGDWMVNYIPENVEFYPTDHCGVLRVKTDEVHPRCLAWVLEQEGKRRGFSRSLRASIDRIKRLTVKLPHIEKQKEIAERVFEYEAQIVVLKKKFGEIESRKQKILANYLNQ